MPLPTPSSAQPSDSTVDPSLPPSARFPKTRVLLVDDHTFVRDGLAGLLDSQSDFEVIGQASTIAGARQALVELRPSLALVDLRLPDGDGVRVLEEVRGMRWGTYAVILSAFSTDDDMVAAARAGARAFLLKTARGEDVLSTLRRVMAGENVLRKDLPLGLRNRLTQKDLTPRETQVLRMVGQGMTNKQISRETSAALNTIKVHLRRIFQKLGVSTRAEAAAVSVRRGLLD